MKRQPFLFLLIPLIFGILFTEFFELDYGVFFIVGLLFLILYFLLEYQKSLYTQFSVYALVFFFFCVGAGWHSFQNSDIQYFTLNKNETLLFKLHKKLNSNTKNKRYEVVVYKENRSFPMVISVPKRVEELKFEYYYRAPLYVNKVEAPKYDYQFNYAKYLARKGILYQGYVYQEVSKSLRSDLSFGERIKKMRSELLFKIDHLKIRSSTKGIILADRTEMSKETVANFTKTGLVHILAISGTHMVILFFTIHAFLWYGIKLPNYRLVVAIALLFIWSFSFFIDFGTSVLRACIMITVYYVYVLLNRKPHLLHSLSLAATIILFMDSHQLFDVGFQLSFAAVLGIYYFNRPLLKRFPQQWQFNPVGKFVLSVLCMTISAQLATLPFVLYYFHHFSMWSIFANLLIVPLAELLIIGALLVVVFTSLGINFTLLFQFYDGFIQIVLKIIEGVSKLMNNVEVVRFSLLEGVVLVVVLACLYKAIVKQYTKHIYRLAFAILVFLSIRFGSDFYWYSKSEILQHELFKRKYVSVKYGDKVIFYTLEGNPEEELKKFVIEPYISSRRVRVYDVHSFSNAKTLLLNIENKFYEIE